MTDRKEQVKRIKGLVDQYLEIVNSEKNKKNMELWQNPYNWNRDKWRGIAPSKSANALPFMVELDISIWRKLVSINLIDFFSDPYVHIESQLKQKIAHFNLLDDNYVYTDEIYIWFGVVTELAIFGSEIIFQEHKEGWIKYSEIRQLLKYAFTR